MELDPDREDFFERLLDVVQPEPNYSARLLAIANSAASGSRVPVTTLRGALARIERLFLRDRGRGSGFHGPIFLSERSRSRPERNPATPR